VRIGGLIVTTIAFTLAAMASSAQTTGDTLTPLQSAVACAPPIAAMAPAPDAPRVIGSQDPEPHTVFGPRDLLVVDGGTARGVALGQEYFLRRALTFAGGYGERTPTLATAAWIKIVAVNDTTAIATIEIACGPIFTGDALQPFAVPQVPPGADRVDASGTLDFTAPASVLSGSEGRRNAVAGELVLIDRGADRGVAPGARFALFRDPRQPAMPLAQIGEGVVVAAGRSTSLLRVNQARAEVQNGDFAVPRR
jgi:hypothetical protein